MRRLKPFKKLDSFLLFLSIILIGFGLLFVFSSSTVTSIQQYGKTHPNYYFNKQIIAVLLGAFLGLFVLVIPTEKYPKLVYLAQILLIGSLIYLLVKKNFIKGATSWLPVAKGVYFQPSEPIKLAYIVWAALFYDKHKDELMKPEITLVPIAYAFLIALLIFLQKDTGTAAVVMFIAYFLFLINPIEKKFKQKFLALSLIFGIIVAFTLFSPNNDIISARKKERINLKDPCSKEKYYGVGNQLCNSYISFNNGGLWGKGIAKSTQKYMYLPDGHTDFIFAIIVEEVGVAGGIFLIVLFVLLLLRMIIIGMSAKSIAHRNMVFGIAAFIFLHVFINIGGITGAIPMTGIPLPFVSYGGTFIMTLILSLAVVQRVVSETKEN